MPNNPDAPRPDPPRGADAPGRRQDWAEHRTDWAEDRTLMANERTFAGWLRTGLGAVAVALGLQAVFREVEPDWLAKAVATGFILVALLIYWSAWRNARITKRRMDSHEAKAMKRGRFGAIAIGVALASAAVAGVLWLA